MGRFVLPASVAIADRNPLSSSNCCSTSSNSNRALLLPDPLFSASPPPALASTPAETGPFSGRSFFPVPPFAPFCHTLPFPRGPFPNGHSFRAGHTVGNRAFGTCQLLGPVLPLASRALFGPWTALQGCRSCGASLQEGTLPNPAYSASFGRPSAFRFRPAASAGAAAESAGTPAELLGTTVSSVGSLFIPSCRMCSRCRDQSPALPLPVLGDARCLLLLSRQTSWIP